MCATGENRWGPRVAERYVACKVESIEGGEQKEVERREVSNVRISPSNSAAKEREQ